VGPSSRAGTGNTLGFPSRLRQQVLESPLSTRRAKLARARTDRRDGPRAYDEGKESKSGHVLML
jgi:hypothetical protein